MSIIIYILIIYLTILAHFIVFFIYIVLIIGNYDQIITTTIM